MRIDALWLATQPIDMRCGADALLARVVQVFGCAQAHHGYLFANARASRVKLLVHDGFGVPEGSAPMILTQPQFDALVLGLPWQRLEKMSAITRM